MRLAGWTKGSGCASSYVLSVRGERLGRLLIEVSKLLRVQIRRSRRRRRRRHRRRPTSGKKRVEAGRGRVLEAVGERWGRAAGRRALAGG